jgi:hypothetical protein
MRMKDITTTKRYWTILLLIPAVAFLTGCSGDSGDTGDIGDQPRQKVTLELQPCAPEYQEVMPRQARTRNSETWTPPTIEGVGYKLFGELHPFTGQDNLTNRNIGIFFTRDGETGTPQKDQFIYNQSESKWLTTAKIDAGSTYYLYGFIPYVNDINASVTALNSETKNFKDGAILSLNGMPSVTVGEVCVLIGAKRGSSPTNDHIITGEVDDGGIVRGKFDYYVTGLEDNYVFLLFDHIYSALKLSIKVDADYGRLRTIRVKEMKLKPKNNGNNIKDKMDVTITLKATNGSDPITDITYAYTGGGADLEVLPIYQTEAGNVGLKLLTTPTDLYASFVPRDITDFTLESTYDVYDSNGNIIRENCRATNALNLGSLFGALGSSLIKGTMYTINLTVNPTYLYVLSDPDLDNPTITIN